MHPCSATTPAATPDRLLDVARIIDVDHTSRRGAASPRSESQGIRRRLRYLKQKTHETMLFTRWEGPEDWGVCVCVSHPVSKGFPITPTFHTSRGMERTCEAPSNEAPHMILGYRQGRLPTYLRQTLIKLFHSRFVCMVVHDTSPKHTRPQQLRRRSDCCRFVTTMLTFSSDRTHAPFRSLTFLPIVAIELTENKCQSVSRSVFPLGCWV